MPQDANATDTTFLEKVDALLEAVRYDDIDDVISLGSAGVPLDSKDSQGRTALHMAAANGHLSIVEYLISKGVVTNEVWQLFPCIICYCCLPEHPLEPKDPPYSFYADVNASNEKKNTTLHWACLNGPTEVVKKLVLSGANLSILNRLQLMKAVSKGKMDIIDAINEAATQLELSGVTIT